MLREFYRAMRLYYRKHHAPHHAAPLRLAVELGIQVCYRAELVRQLRRPPGQRYVGAARAVARR